MAYSSNHNLEDLNITKDEIDRIGNALKKEEFRKLLVEYCEEIQDPKNKQKYEEEITQLEKERGVDVTFINPLPGYVIKTSVNGNQKAFINICMNEHVEKPTSTPTKRTPRGLQWQLPHTLSPPREDTDKKGDLCMVYDVVYHPDTLRLAQNNDSFKNMINTTACDSIESNFQVTLDKKNLKHPNLKYKGFARPTVIRKTIEGFIENIENKEFLEKLCPYPYDKQNTKVKPQHKKKEASKCEETAYATPKYSIKHRSDIDIQDFTESKVCKINAAIPKELIVEIHLPLLKSSTHVNLDVTEKSINLVCDKPSKYKLHLTLPYAVDEDSGTAKFDMLSRKLVIVLPVKRKRDFTLSDIVPEDSGVDTDHCSNLSSSVSDDEDLTSKKVPLVSEIVSNSDILLSECDSDAYRTKSVSENSFLDHNLHYIFPEFIEHIYDSTLAFTLHVKNVDPDSVEKCYFESDSGIHLKFSSISSGFFFIHYSFCAKFPISFNSDDISIEVWDNNVIVQIPFKDCDNPLITYFAGPCQNSLDSYNIKECSIITEKPATISEDLTIESQYYEEKDEMIIEIKPSKPTETILPETEEKVNTSKKENPKKIEKVHSFSESSGDETSLSQSPVKSKGILKCERSKRRNIVNRSVSESSVDDFTWPNSLDNYNGGSDSCIPEEREEDCGSKKTVRFNDHITKQLFRSNSSILGQRKKNQRKARNKKRAQERRHSESELSETEDKKEIHNKIMILKRKQSHENKASGNENSKEKHAAKSKNRERKDSGNCSDLEKKGKDVSTKGSNDKLKPDEFKSDLIFDLDM